MHNQLHPATNLFLLELDVYLFEERALSDLQHTSERESWWVLGGENPLPTRARLRNSLIDDHLNGVALYRTSSPEFMGFLIDVWLPSLIVLANRWPEIAFDVVTAPGVWPELPPPLRDRWICNQEKFIRTSSIQNCSNLSVVWDDFMGGPEKLSKVLGIPTAPILHVKVTKAT